MSNIAKHFTWTFFSRVFTRCKEWKKDHPDAHEDLLEDLDAILCLTDPNKWIIDNPQVPEGKALMTLLRRCSDHLKQHATDLWDQLNSLIISYTIYALPAALDPLPGKETLKKDDEKGEEDDAEEEEEEEEEEADEDTIPIEKASAIPIVIDDDEDEPSEHEELSDLPSSSPSSESLLTPITRTHSEPSLTCHSTPVSKERGGKRPPNTPQKRTMRKIFWMIPVITIHH